jgi:Glycosyl transferase family 11
MIIIQTEGGLGNQMFQYALGMAFAEKGILVKMDISRFEEQFGHNGYELERVFGMNAMYCSATERELVKRISKVKHLLFKTPYKEKNEWQWQYHHEVLKLQSGFLKGYWQSWKYFAAAELQVKQTFRFPALQDEQNKATEQKMVSTNSVSIHIRRGDYLNSNVNCSLPVSYYHEAIAFINKNISNPFYFVFSDDIDWAKENIQEQQVEFIGWNKGDNSYADMQLMSLCKHNIIANSSFSWWGAWLNKNANKTVIAPTPWMPSHTKGKDIIPDNWIQLPAAFVNTEST